MVVVGLETSTEAVEQEILSDSSCPDPVKRWCTAILYFKQFCGATMFGRTSESKGCRAVMIDDLSILQIVMVIRFEISRRAHGWLSHQLKRTDYFCPRAFHVCWLCTIAQWCTWVQHASADKHYKIKLCMKLFTNNTGVYISESQGDK